MKKLQIIFMMAFVFTQQLFCSAVAQRRAEMLQNQPQPITEHIRIVKKVYDIINATNQLTSPVTTPVTSPVTSPVTTPVTSPVTTPVTSPVTTPVTSPTTTPVTSPVTTQIAAMTYSQLTTALETVTPYTINNLSLSANNPSFLNFNVNTAGYAFFKNPWGSAPAGSTASNGVAADLTSTLTSASQWQSGVTFILAAIDGNNSIISSSSMAVPVSFGLYVFDSQQNLLKGSPFIFPATSLGTGTVSTAAITQSGVVVGGVTGSLSMKYPFALKVIATPSVGTVTASAGVKVYPFNQNALGTTLPTASTKSNMSKVANGGNAITIPNGAPLTLLSVSLSDSTGWLVFEFDQSAIATIPASVLSAGLYIGVEQTLNGSVNTATVVLMDSSQNVYASGSYVSSTSFQTVNIGFNILNSGQPLVAGQAVLNQVSLVDGTGTSPVVLFKNVPVNYGALTYSQLTSLLGTVTPYSINNVPVTGFRPTTLNFNVGSASYPLFAPVELGGSLATFAADITTAFTSSSVLVSGVNFVLVAIDANNVIIPSGSTAVAANFYLYMFDSKQNPLPGSPVSFGATIDNLTAASTLPITQTGVSVAGLSTSPLSMTYPFVLTATTPAQAAAIVWDGTTKIIQPGAIADTGYYTSLLAGSTPPAPIDNLNTASSIFETLGVQSISYLTVKIYDQYTTVNVPFIFNINNGANAVTIPTSELQNGVYVTVSIDNNNNAVVALSDVTGKSVYATGTFPLAAPNNQYYQITNFGVAVNNTSIWSAPGNNQARVAGAVLLSQQMCVKIQQTAS